MAGQEQDQDKTEKATPFKLREAHKKGQVAKSLEVNSFVIIATALALTYLALEKMIIGQLVYSREIFSSAHDINIDVVTTLGWYEASLDYLLALYLPLAGIIMLVGILSNIMQTGPVFTFFPLKPDLQRINPVAGLKRLFSKKLLFEAFKSFFKLTLFSFIVYFTIVSLLPKLVALHNVDPDQYNGFLIGLIQGLVAKLLIAMFIIGMLDLAYTRWEFANKMKMSHRELKEEVKRREGDPHVRAKRRELQKEAAQRAGSLQKVPDADVLITNPTHLAIALKYDKDKMVSPEVIAKGAGELAQKMKLVARNNKVPIVENKPLARKLFKTVELNQGVTEELYPLIAKVLVWVYTLRNQKANGLPTAAATMNTVL